jgi:hypothetical protein
MNVTLGVVRTAITTQFRGEHDRTTENMQTRKRISACTVRSDPHRSKCWSVGNSLLPHYTFHFDLVK